MLRERVLPGVESVSAVFQTCLQFACFGVHRCTLEKSLPSFGRFFDVLPSWGGLASVPGTLELCTGERVEDCDDTSVTHLSRNGVVWTPSRNVPLHRWRGREQSCRTGAAKAKTSVSWKDLRYVATQRGAGVLCPGRVKRGYIPVRAQVSIYIFSFSFW